MEVENENTAFFLKLKLDSERFWQNIPLEHHIYGFQIRPGTKWLPGLKAVEIDAFEEDIGFHFPQIYRQFLAYMNGTDKETINLFGESGYAYTYSAGYYSYPRDLAQVKDLIAWIYEAFEITEEDVRTRAIPHILPLVSHRFLVVDNCASNPVLSMYGDDVIIYARDLPTFLVNDIFNDGASDKAVATTLTLNVPFWLTY